MHVLVSLDIPCSFNRSQIFVYFYSLTDKLPQQNSIGITLPNWYIRLKNTHETLPQLTELDAQSTTVHRWLIFIFVYVQNDKQSS